MRDDLETPPSLLALFRKGTPGWDKGGKNLDDDRSGDIGVYAQRGDAQVLERTA
jgi:hypothetical protein